MQRRQFIQDTAFAFGALALSNQQLLTAFFEDPWKIKMLTDEVGIFTERGGTIAFAFTKEGIIVVDSQFPEQSRHLVDELKKRNDKPIKLLINTHHHADHSGGNITFKGLTEHVLAHTNSRINQENVARQNKSEDKQLYPDNVYNYIWRQKIGKEMVALHYFGAAHTNGDSFVHFEHANIVHCGDLVFNRRHPFVDRGAGANMKSWMNVLDNGINQFSNKTTFIFGHSGQGFEVTGTADDLRAFRDYLGSVLKFVESEIKSGKSKDEILKATSIPGADQWKGDGIQRPLTAAYEELTVL
ncbi:MAG TPA: MBL fold metallo-hydrolase [Chitinophagaceae bacterium]|nr:MBL fold metallo-hydrolase [Chitinophagaceae bacterium]